jgi:proteasome accessory factor C
MERLLSIVPWVAANDGPLLSEVARRFDYPEQRLLADLTEVVFMVGVFPFTPDQLIEVVVEDGRVWIHYADYFARPLRLTPPEALQLVAAGQSLLAVPGADPDGPLARGLAKLAAVLGVTPGAGVDVDLGSADASVLAAVRSAIAIGERLDLEYYAYGRDEVQARRVDPYRLFSEQGNWYLLAYCHRAEDERLFRLDRIRRATATGDSFVAPPELPTAAVFDPRPDDPRVTLRLAPAAAWVIEAYPCEQVEALPGGDTRAVLAISATGWLERLLLRLGPDAVVEDVTGDLGVPPEQLAARAAARVLARYALDPQAAGH